MYDFDAIVRRLGNHCADLKRKYPTVWKDVDEHRKQQKGHWLGTWPNYCFLPLGIATVIAHPNLQQPQLQKLADPRQMRSDALDMSRMCALAPWRLTKGIYAFDPTLFDELWDSRIGGDIPADVLEKLPEWCCYVPYPPSRATPEEIVDRQRLLGFFVWMEYDIHSHQKELYFMLDGEEDGKTRFLIVPLLLAGTFQESFDLFLKRTGGDATDFYRRTGQIEKLARIEPEMEQIRARVGVYSRAIQPLVSLVLYLCYANAEILGRDGKMRPMNRPLIRHSKRRDRTFAAEQPMFWEVGWRLGRTLRAAAPSVAGPDRGGTHAGPKPHLRKAHWHGFWTGPKAKPGLARETERQFILKWLHPILVNADREDGHIIPTVYPVAAP